MSDLMERAERKVLSIEDLTNAVADLKRRGKTIAHCHGVFDLVHPGHIRHLRAASKQADVLVVTVTADKYVNKGPGRPVYKASLRAEILAALEYVDFVTINEAPSAVDLITRIAPNVYVKGKEYETAEDDVTGMIVEEAAAVEAAGGRIHFTDEMVMSSSELINSYFDVFRPETQRWLAALKQNHPPAEIVKHIQRLRDVNVVVIGEAIIDEYVFCDVLGRSTKDPLLAFRYASTETYAGGSLAVANHLAGLCGEVKLVTLIGEKDGKQRFIKEHLKPNVELTALKQLGAPTIHKRRYLDTHTGAKVFELYTLDEAPLRRRTEDQMLEAIEGCIGQADVVVVADYGHGMLTQRAVDLITEKAPFLALNTQSNAGNRGFNTVSKYLRADYVCLNGGEVELELRQRRQNHADPELLTNVASHIDCPKFTMTLGRDGTMHYDRAQGMFTAPALATSVADRVGAGDAVLAVTAPMVALSMPWEIVGFVGNLAGAEAVSQLGTSRLLETATLIKHTEAILK